MSDSHYKKLVLRVSKRYLDYLEAQYDGEELYEYWQDTALAEEELVEWLEENEYDDVDVKDVMEYIDSKIGWDEDDDY
jgi:hypothetical protein